jgi:hypothetical protein
MLLVMTFRSRKFNVVSRGEIKERISINGQQEQEVQQVKDKQAAKYSISSPHVQLLWTVLTKLATSHAHLQTEFKICPLSKSIAPVKKRAV